MILVFDVGGSSVKYACMTTDGLIHYKGKVKTPIEMEDTLDDFIGLLFDTYNHCQEKFPIEGIAFSLPGQIDDENGIVYGGGALRYMHKAHLIEALSKKINLPIAMENDGKCAALAEVWQGNAKGCKDACVLLFGTGIGGGIIIDGKVHRGTNFLAGEVSFCFDNLSFDDLDKVDDIDANHIDVSLLKYPHHWTCITSTRALVLKAAAIKNMNPNDVSGEKIFKWVEEGDAEIKRLVEELYFNIAKYCCNMYLIINPEIILIGGGISEQPDFVDGIRRYVTRLSKASKIYDNIKIDVCKYKNDSNLLGALYNYMQKFN